VNGATRAAIALGCNLGDCTTTLAAARAAIRGLPDTALLGAVADVRTAAIAPAPQPDYLNGMVVVRTTLAPAALLDALHAIETAHGRTRPARHAPRTLDLDLVWVDGVDSDAPSLVLPHPALAARPWLRAQLAALVGEGAAAQALAVVRARRVADPRTA
jgi:2-amino-4-hydroxy-6-hydroxymethyldihydropteridine diphosphokinase